MGADQWIFGYGSLVWRPAFDYVACEPGFILGYRRRFWQASPDHRGTPEQPGRVVTLLEAAGEICWGMGYRVDASTLDLVLQRLDHREKAGYRRISTTLYFRDQPDPAEGTLVYVAGPDNPNFVGEQPLEEIARVIRNSRGPSGDNVQYVRELHRALVDMGGRDEHVAELASLLAGKPDEG